MRDIYIEGKQNRTENGFMADTCMLNHQTGTLLWSKQFSDECFGFSAVIPETVGQCTGLKDKNGNWIFEGDIFKFDDEVWSSYYTSCGTEYDSYDVVNYGAIGFNKDSASYDFIKYKYNENSIEADLHENCNIEFADFVTELEVIGNKWDNPELLEVEK